jgi:hypothetical protein
MKDSSNKWQKLLGNCVGFVLMITGLHVYAGNLTASVDRDSLGLEETFTLTLRYDEQINATPNYDLLQKDFDILNTQSGTQMSIINGNMEASTEWKIALAPKRIGKLLIPSFTVDGAVSDAIEMTIDGKSKSPKDANNNVNVEIETSKDTGYVQEQIIATLRLYTTVGLSGIDLQPLQIKDALVVQLDEKQYQTKINGQPGAVVETRYAIFPQKSGELIIPSMLYQVSLNAGQRDLWDRFYGNSRNNVLRLRTEEQRLNILATPTTVNPSEWLPATNVSLSEHWSTSINSLKIGEPITRSITIKADGLTASQISPLQLAPIDGLTFYNDQAQNDDQKSANGVTGSRIETIAIVPTKAGHFTLPEVNVKWWDTKTNSLRTATLPEVHLTVGLGDMTPQQMTESMEAQTTTSPTAVDLNTDLNSIPNHSTTIQYKVPLWLYISNILSAIIAIVFILKFWQSKRELHSRNTTENEKLTESFKKEGDAWNNFKRKLADKQLAELRKAMIQWAQVYWQDSKISSLQSVAENIDNAKFSEELRKLDQAIFSASTEAPDTEVILQALANLRKSKHKNSANNQKLHPLYKQ